MKIFVVNDCSADIIEALLMAKDDFKVEVDKATDGNEAFRLYRQHPAKYDLVLTDIADPRHRRSRSGEGNPLEESRTDVGFRDGSRGRGKIVPLGSFANDRWMVSMTGKKQSLPLELRDIPVLGTPYEFEQLLALVYTSTNAVRR